MNKKTPLELEKERLRKLGFTDAPLFKNEREREKYRDAFIKEVIPLIEEREKRQAQLLSSHKPFGGKKD